MRRSVLCAAAAAVTMSIMVPVPAQAAVKMFVMSGNSLGDYSGIGCSNLSAGLTSVSIPDLLCTGGPGCSGNVCVENRCDRNKCDEIAGDVLVPDQLCPGQGQPEQEQPGQGQPEQERPEASGYVQQVIALVNKERGKAGLAPLTENQDMARAAGVRAEEISRSFSHTRPDGSSFSTALTQSGVSYHGAGENIAYGQPTPEAVMESWMNSQGHRANILNGDYTTIGVGYYENGNGTGYWTQLFTY